MPPRIDAELKCVAEQPIVTVQALLFPLQVLDWAPACVRNRSKWSPARGGPSSELC
jgi:hypothetical protein